MAGYLDGPRGGNGGAEVDALPGHAVATAPGDVIVFDGHLFHASAGGRDRRQWRVDFVADPVGTEEATVQAYFAGVYPPDWDGGYDVDPYPSYGGHWRGRPRPWGPRLAELGVYDRAPAGEEFTRSQQARSPDAGGGMRAGGADPSPPS